MKPNREEREKDRRVWKPVTYECRVCDRVRIPWEGNCKECLEEQCWEWLDELPLEDYGIMVSIPRPELLILYEL